MSVKNPGMLLCPITTIYSSCVLLSVVYPEMFLCPITTLYSSCVLISVVYPGMFLCPLYTDENVLACVLAWNAAPLKVNYLA